MTEALQKLQQMADKADEKKAAQREKMKQRYPDIHAFIVELEKVFGPVTGRVKSR